MRTNKICSQFGIPSEATSISPRASSSSTLPSLTLSGHSSLISRSSNTGEHSGNDSDGGGSDDEQVEEAMELVDGELMEVDGSLLHEDQRYLHWIVEEVVEEERPNTSNRSGEISRQESTLPALKLPRGLKPGAKNIPVGIENSPYGYWRLLWDDTVIEEFCLATCAYASSSGKPIDEITSDEMVKYFGIIMFMGVVKLPNRRMYFAKATDKFATNFVKTLMSYKRFEEITRNLHIMNTLAQNLSQTEVIKRNRDNPFWPVQTFTEILNRNFCHYWRSNQNNSVDEMSIPFKGRHRARVYNPNKPEKWHFKAFCLNDASTGYLTRFEMYGGKDEVRPAAHSATAWAVLNLVIGLHRELQTQTNDAEGFNMCNYILFTDNWYTSIELASALLLLGIIICGTIKSNRKGLPKEGIFPKTGRNVQLRGTMQRRYVVHSSGSRIQFVSWMDNKPVHMLTTLPSVYRSTVQRNMRENTRWVKKPIAIPTIVQAYNKGMGGTDLNDQYNSYYKTTLKTVKWAPRIFSHFLMVSVTNARVLYMSHNSIEQDSLGHSLPLLEFIDSLLGSIAGHDDEESSEDNEQVQPLKKRRTEASHLGYEARLHGHQHTPCDDGKTRRECPVCKIRCRTFCKECNVCLHINNNNGLNCWHLYHNEADFTKD